MRILQVTELDAVHWSLARDRFPPDDIHDALVADGARPLTLLKRWLPAAEVKTVFIGDPRGGNEAASLAAQVAAFQPDILAADIDLLGTLKAALKLPDTTYLAGLYVGEPEAMPALPIDFSIAIVPARTTAAATARVVHCPVAFPETIAARDRSTDIVFAGPVSADTRKAVAALTAIAKAPLGLRGEFSARYHVECDLPAKLPVGITMNDMGPVRGRALIEAMSTAKVAIVSAEGRSDLNHLETLLTAAASGAALVIERRRLAGQIFTPDQDCLAYTDPNSAVEAVYRLLEKADERAEFARRARARALPDAAVTAAWQHVAAALDAAVAGRCARGRL